MDLAQKFQAMFGARPRLFLAPGRVNLIGEHTDYNAGFVMPVALDLGCQAAAAVRDDRKLVIHSGNREETFEARLDGSLVSPKGQWSDYPAGVALQLQEAGFKLRGASLLIHSDVPLGAGLSSSAALEVATGYALLALAGYSPDPTQLALLCQRAENEFVGARCGIMDQFIACNAQAGQALLLDCRSLQGRFLPLPENVQLAICDTGIKHDLAHGVYNTRRSECEQVVRGLARVLPGIQALRDVTMAQLEEHRGELEPTIYRRARHVIGENGRVLKAADALEEGGLRAFGEYMAESHGSLRDDYEVSCAELDLMVELANRQAGVYGSRMTGGGFGGCTVNLVNAADTPAFRRGVAQGYRAATGRSPRIFVCKASAGAREIEL